MTNISRQENNPRPAIPHLSNIYTPSDSQTPPQTAGASASSTGHHHPQRADPDLGWNSQSNVLNLSKLFTPSAAQTRVLERGLTFIPRPTEYDWEELQRDLHQYHRRIKIIDYFSHKTDFTHIPFTHPSNWEPLTSHLHNKIQVLLKADRRALRSYRPPRDVLDNLLEDERRALTQLANNPNIIIKPADKGSKIVILDRQQYLLETDSCQTRGTIGQYNRAFSRTHKPILGTSYRHYTIKKHHSQTERLSVWSRQTQRQTLLFTSENS